jgi:RNA ligase
MTPTFEYTAPLNRIVINYAEEELFLLHIRNNVTGDYMDYWNLKSLSAQWSIPLVYQYQFNPADKHSGLSLEHFFHSLEVDEGMEGYVFQNETGEMFKAKSKWYLNLHHNMVFLTERNVAEMVLEETLDDYKSYLTESGSVVSLERVEKIETEISLYLATLENSTIELYEAEGKGKSKKDFAIKCSKHRYFGLAIRLFDGKEPDYKDYYHKHFLKEHFSCAQV